MKIIYDLVSTSKSQTKSYKLFIIIHPFVLKMLEPKSFLDSSK